MLRTKDAAKYLDVSKYTLEAWRCQGGGPAFIKMKKAVRYRQEDLDAFLNSNIRTSTSEQVER